MFNKLIESDLQITIIKTTEYITDIYVHDVNNPVDVNSFIYYSMLYTVQVDQFTTCFYWKYK